MIITLLTDFGTKDWYVGAMKGVILGINPEAKIVDISHQIPPQDTQTASFLLSNSYHYFPRGSIHLVVVDPSVGGERRPILVETKSHLFVGPDNGIFTEIYRKRDFQRVIHLKNEKYFLSHQSSTFHGRDIFAPVAAHLSLGLKPEEFGLEIGDPIAIEASEPKIREGKLAGRVIYIDFFGNIITNISQHLFSQWVGDGNFEILIGKEKISELSSFYAEGEEGRTLALFSSQGLLEIALRNAKAQKILGVEKGDQIFIIKKS